MRSVSATIAGLATRTVMRVISLAELPTIWNPELSLLVRARNQDDVIALNRLERAGVRGLHVLVDDESLAALTCLPIACLNENSLQMGDVVALTPGRQVVQVLYRESDSHHTIFLTNRCNSYCVMCSQPPTNHDDS